MIRIMKTKEVPYSEIFARSEAITHLEGVVAEIIQTVREKKDAALFDYAQRFDHAFLSSLEVSKEEIEEAYALVGEDFLSVLEKAAKNIRTFHLPQKQTGYELRERPGVVMGVKITPIERVGLYVPGGTAAYPATDLMNAIPAKVTGCSKIVMTTPPGKDGRISPAVLAAAKVAGVDRIFKVGGAGAIAALAYGTETIPKVDKIVGPGNAFVALAKRQVFGTVSIDMIAGPSEILIVSDGQSDPRHVCADLLSQAEHDKMASAVLVTDSYELALAVREELERQIEKLERKEIARASIENNGKIIVTDDLLEAIAIANEIAPEHLELMVDAPFDYLDQIRNAGSVFLGRNCPEALGDYLSGTNHTLPTSGTARFSSPLSVDDFIKKTQYSYYTKEALSGVAQDVARFARQEGLGAHARSALIRFEEEEK